METWPEKIFRDGLISSDFLYECLPFELCVTDSPYLNRCLLDLTSRKFSGAVLKFLKGGGSFSKYLYLTIL